MARKIIDSHLHLSESKEDALIPFAKLNGLKYDMAELLSLMEEYGVSFGLLLSTLLNDGSHLPNRKVLELCERSGGKLLPIFTVKSNKSSVEEAIELARKNRGLVRGFKVVLGYEKVFPYDKVFSSMYDFAEAEDLPVLFHTGDTATNSGSLEHSHPLTLDRLANERENLKIVACHFGNPWITDVGELIYKHPNVHSDISGLITGVTKYSPQFIESLAEKISDAIYFAGGADKVLFGTDYPVETYAKGLDLVKRLKIDQGDKYKILFDNARTVFSI